VKRILAPALLLATSASYAQYENITYQSTEVAPGIYMTIGINPDAQFGGGNLGFVVGDDYVAVIDDGMAPPAPALVAHIQEVAGRPVDFVINTHYHGDHTGANAAFAATGSIVFAHHNIRERLLEDIQNAGGEGGLPVVTFGDGVTFHLNGYEAHVVHVPTAHTDGDSFIVVKDANVILAGDLQFHGRFPFIDLEGGGSVSGYVAAQQMIANLADENTKIIPGHGDLSTLERLKRDTAMLIDGHARVKELVEAGMSEDEVVEAAPLADYASDFDWYFINSERMTRTFYQDLTSGE
jgi:glyoxylase-like metal-dependent hydrolase (beta-lactamase superfamily II)